MTSVGGCVNRGVHLHVAVAVKVHDHDHDHDHVNDHAGRAFWDGN
jgi:hypothetical protein